MKNLIRFLSFVVMISCISCQKEPITPSPPSPPKSDCILSTLPPVTAVGANTMGCIIDGEVWSPYVKPDGNLFVPPTQALRLDFYHPHRALTIYCTREISDTCRTEDEILDITMRYNDQEIITSIIPRYTPFDDDNNGDYFIDYTEPFYRKIHRWDRKERVIAGELGGTFKNDRTGEQIRIDSLRFDVGF